MPFVIDVDPGHARQRARSIEVRSMHPEVAIS